jgi:hypothetical protein
MATTSTVRTANDSPLYEACVAMDKLMDELIECLLAMASASKPRMK